MSDIMERLKQLGVTKGIPEKLKKPLPSRNPFAPLLRTFPLGIVAENDMGPYFLNRMTQALTEPHGRVTLEKPFTASPLFDAILGFPNLQAEEVLSMDTETSGLGYGAAEFVFMIGMGYVQGEQYIVDQLILPDLSYEPAFLRQIEQTFQRFRAMVTYNGKGFDVPMIKSRADFHLFPNFCAKIEHVDLLQITRKYWAPRMGSVRLANMERHVLELQRGIEETPGSEAPERYRKYLREGDASHIQGISYHNRIDVVSLHALLQLINHLCAQSTEDLSAWEERGASPTQVVKYNHSFLSDAIRVKYGTFNARDKKQMASRAAKNKDLITSAAFYAELADRGDSECAVKAMEMYNRLKMRDEAEKYRQIALNLIQKDPTIGVWTKKERMETLSRPIAGKTEKKK